MKKLNKDPFNIIPQELGPNPSTSFLDFDQSSVDPRFSQDYYEEGAVPFRKNYAIAAILFIFAIFGLRLFNLEIVHGQEYLGLAEGNRLRVQYTLAPRGLFYDSHGQIVVQNEPSFELVFIPSDIPKEDDLKKELFQAVAQHFELDVKIVEDRVNSADVKSFHSVTLVQDVDKEKAISFLVSPFNYPGFSIQSNPRRQYIDGKVYAHAFGYTGKLTDSEYQKLKDQGYLYNDLIGKSGLEVYYEEFLRGVPGEKLVEVDANGTVKNTFQEKKALPGDDLYLYLDAGLQKQLFDSIEKQLSLHRATRAAAVAVDPKTGGVLALISIPSFDNNNFAHGVSEQQYQALLKEGDLPLFNRAIAGTYPPGSTIKPLLAAAALQEGVIDDDTKIFDGGALYVPNQYDPSLVHTFHGWQRAGLGIMDVYSAIAMSSDIYFYTVGGGQSDLNIDGLGINAIAHYLRKFYLGRTTGIDIPGEKSALVPTPEWKEERYAGSPVDQKWYLGDTYNTSIGQGFMLASPLQVSLATAAIANGGTVMKPQLVKKIVDREGKEILNYEPEILSSGFIDSENIKIVQKGMRQTVTEGTARSLSQLPITVAGKTGTSQFDGSDLSRTHAWFTAYAPFEDPQITLTVLIEAGGEGSGAAAAVAREVLGWYALNRLENDN